ncbi:RING-H2 finger protein ATL39-like [Panicum virgatum]|uniref:RING-type E3 ubiquitin transferase n=1 Tax=Panicum virgatum TaxID=38727 RepID=A0A8T0SJV6_PANVG|nr:RING-H2 finger protein ATL39-like [Panicum virgatum]KAG2597233.1 hypothetical protein PVAP13_5KG193800 [Panicum virgatum]
MSGQSSSPYGETDTGADAAPASSSSSIRWAPHGRAMTACLVAVNVALVALVYLYFWRVFSRKRASSSSSGGGDEEDEEDRASSSASAPPSPGRAQDDEQRRRLDRLVASLPAFVARPGAGAGAGAGAECAVCLAELRDGDAARALPRCGHRFHAACVDAWLRRRHTTCPLCRASVVVAAGAAAEGSGPKGGGGGVTGTAAAAAVVDTDAPV